ncbi:hypothetical protein [Brevibacterium oceani]|uniref:hypothetical protein n=1 Tax=Brevibacterium oceani TaxID=358099 RepID=UPI0015E7C490|nr:hypothetical protein [Brevibacterium oceani]
MAYRRDYVVTLRIFEPLVVHSELQDRQVEDNRSRVERQISQDADKRLISLPPSPVADSFRRTPIFLPASQTADGVDRFCPAQEDIRGWEALESLTEHTSKATLDIIAPKSARRRAASRRAEWLQDAKDTRIFTRVSAWDVPPAWWLFFSLSEDQIITEETDAGLRVIIRTDILAASARMEWAAETVADNSKVVDMVEQTSALAEWIDMFDMNSILELDLGGMSDVLWPNEAPELVDSWVTALSNDDHESAVAAFQKYAAAWEQLNLYARSS